MKCQLASKAGKIIQLTVVNHTVIQPITLIILDSEQHLTKEYQCPFSQILSPIITAQSPNICVKQIAAWFSPSLMLAVVT